MALRLAVLIALFAAFAACTKSPRVADRACDACHAAHYVREGTCQDCHRGEPTTNRVELAHTHLLTGAAAAHRLPDSRAVREGRALVEALACRRCHTIGGQGNALATNLDRVVWKREQAALVASITQPVAFMPRFALNRRQAESLVATLLRSGDPVRAQEAYRVHFDGRVSQDGVFERSCGGCHRIITARGPLGSGDAGPNLSGLFTPFYPKTARNGRRWTPELLEEWIKNPRAVRPGTTMLPVRLSAGDLARAVQQLDGDRLRTQADVTPDHR